MDSGRFRRSGFWRDRPICSPSLDTQCDAVFSVIGCPLQHTALMVDPHGLATAEKKALPVVLGGDHAVNIPCVRAFSAHGPIHIVQIDAHLDFVDVRHGVREGHGNPMRRAAEQPHVSGLTQIGIRNVSSTARDGYDDARRRGSTILSVRQARELGVEGVLAEIPAGVRYYVTLDIDGFDPSIAPGTGTPSHGGFLYYEVMEILQGLSQIAE